MPITDHREMNTSLPEVLAQLDDLSGDFTKAFGDGEITSERVAFALEQFLLTLISADSPMDDTATKRYALSEQEAPYMHDGRFAPLEEAVAHYNIGIKPSDTLDPNLAKHLRHSDLNLSTEDQATLVSFLKAFTDEGLKNAE